MEDVFDVVVIGAGPAGLEAAMRAGELGARTALIASDRIGGMGANDGPVPVRTLAHAARLAREARQMQSYGIDIGTPRVDFGKLLERVRTVVEDVHRDLGIRNKLESLGVVIYEHAGRAGFVSSHEIETESGIHLRGRSFVLCTGGKSRRLPFDGVELTATHSDAWSLTAVPESMVVVGAGATGLQLASIFNAFGCRVSLFEAAPRILMTEDEDVSVAVRDAYREDGIEVVEGFGTIEAVEPHDGGVRFRYERSYRDVSLVVLAIGWEADVRGMSLHLAGVETDAKGYVRVNEFMQTSAPHVYAAGDIDGHSMLVPNAAQEGFFAATNAVAGPRFAIPSGIVPVGSFTDPEYASVGMSEARARQEHDCVVGVVRFDAHPRCIIDGRTRGFCKLVVDRPTRRVLGASVVGERAVETIQMAAVAMAGGVTADALDHLALSFPTYVESFGRAAHLAVRQLGASLEPTASTWEPSAMAFH
jgi:dihydrolipoamide dehydrogenase